MPEPSDVVTCYFLLNFVCLKAMTGLCLGISLTLLFSFEFCGEFYETYVLPLAKTIEAKKVTKKVGGGCGPDYEPAEEIEVQQIV